MTSSKATSSETVVSEVMLPKQFIAATGLPNRVVGGQTSRQSLSPQLESAVPFNGFNLALHVGDDAMMVHQQRIELLKSLQSFGVQRLVWLEQTHSNDVQVVTSSTHFLPVHADALITREAGVACMIMTADCLPIVLSNIDGSEVACIHAGWRGLLNGIIENAINAMQTLATHSWFGAAIGACHFEVGAEVYDLFMQQNLQNQAAFKAQPADKYLADLYLLAKIRLKDCHIEHITGGEACTYQQSSQFYSYRQQSHTGRMATFVMIRPN